MLLPALHLVFVYLAFAAAALALTHRYVRPLSRSAALVLALLPLCLTGGSLLTGKVYAPLDMVFSWEPFASDRGDFGVERPHNAMSGDLTFQIVPWHAAVRQAWAAGDWPLMNPTMLAGDTLAQSAQAAPYHPINVVALALPLDLSLTFIAAAVLLCAGIGGFVFARELGCRETASFFAAAGWAFCGFGTFWLGWPMATTVAFFPLVTTAVRRVTRGPDRRSALLLAAAFVLVALGGHPESLLHATAVGAIYGLFEVASIPGPSRLRKAASAVAAALVAGVLALLACAVYLLPIVDALPQTEQYRLRHDLFAALDHSVPWPEALDRAQTNLLPHRYGLGWGETVPGPEFFVPHSNAYAGSVLFALALFGLWRHPWRGRWLLGGVYLFGVAMGASAPWATHFVASLPLFEIGIHKRLVFAAAWALATLAALGAEAWATRPERRLAALHLAVTAGLGALVAKAWGPMTEDGLSPELLAHYGLWLLVPVAAAAAVCWLGGGARRAGRPGTVLAALLGLLLVQRAAEVGDRYPDLDRRLAYPAVPILEHLPATDAPYRFVGVGMTMPANLGAIYGFEDVRGYQPMTLAHLVRTYHLWPTEPHVYFNQVHRLGSPFLDLLNVRWGMAPASYRPPEPWRVVARDRGVQLLENPRALGRAFIPREVHLDMPPKRQMAGLEACRDFGATAWIDTPARADHGPDRPRANGPGTLTVRKRGTGLRIDAAMEGPGWVVVSQPAWDGWRARTPDGGELPLARANRSFLAFELPAGDHRVDLVYRPRSFGIGLWTSAGTVAALLLGWLGSMLISQSRRPANPASTAARPSGIRPNPGRPNVAAEPAP
ncbi:MAG: YfhO family protein [Acidobacteriota bacterium]